MGLAIAAYTVYVLVWLITIAAGAHPSYVGGAREIVSPGLDLTTVVAVCLLNPVYEETFLCGYIVTRGAESHRVMTAINVSVGLRLLCHLYQGGIGVIMIIPLGLVFSWWYARTRQLWPLFVAHSLFDAIGLLRYVG